MLWALVDEVPAQMGKTNQRLVTLTTPAVDERLKFVEQSHTVIILKRKTSPYQVYPVRLKIFRLYGEPGQPSRVL
jgi:hypothetical protein